MFMRYADSINSHRLIHNTDITSIHRITLPTQTDLVDGDETSLRQLHARLFEEIRGWHHTCNGNSGCERFHEHRSNQALDSTTPGRVEEGFQ